MHLSFAADRSDPSITYKEWMELRTTRRVIISGQIFHFNTLIDWKLIRTHSASGRDLFITELPTVNEVKFTKFHTQGNK